tara:strand:+ start:6324 stop:8405 length:2082 start_codon:yes stop_codon:yes gene_type:complete
MQQGALFDSGILGTSFHWWIGQIADDSTWRENISSKPTESPYENKGWGRRYRVRILGLHDQGENEIPSDKLPWAQIMYPVTAGSSNTNSLQSPNLRQGNMVFGFFLDGQEMRIPLIMGVLGNNAQTIGATTIGAATDESSAVTNTQPGSLAVSGYATGAKPKDPATGEKETPPDSDLSAVRPGAPPESAPIPPNVKLNKYGLRPDLTPTRAQFADAQAARQEAARKGLSFAETEDLVMKRVAKGIKDRKNEHESPTTPPSAPAYRESPDVQQITAADIKRDEEYKKKTALAKPDDLIQSAIKSIQIVIDNLTESIDKLLHSIQSYTDAVSDLATPLEDIMHKGACEMTKYMKVIFDKVMEFILKQLNVVMSEVISALPTSLRNNFGDLKEIITQQITGMYNQMTGGLCEQIKGVLSESLNSNFKNDERAPATVSDLVEDARKLANNNPQGFKKFRTKPKVSVCQAETLTATLLAKNKKEIDKANTNVIRNVNSYIDGLQSQMGSISGLISSGSDAISGGIGAFSAAGDFMDTASQVSNGMDGVLNMIPDISSGLSGALDFKNIIYSIFPGELEPKKALSDFYQLATGGSGTGDKETPSVPAIGEYIKRDSISGVENLKTDREFFGQVESVPDFAQPSTSTPSVDLSPDKSLQATLDREDAAYEKALEREQEEREAAQRLLDGETIDGQSFEMF